MKREREIRCRLAENVCCRVRRRGRVKTLPSLVACRLLLVRVDMRPPTLLCAQMKQNNQTVKCLKSYRQTLK